MMRVFVTGTDTGVGKTQVACALLSLLADEGLRPAPFKPYESGCEDLRKPADALALREAAQSDDPLDLVCPHRFKQHLAPGVAAVKLKKEPSFEKTLQAFRSFEGRSLVVEGAGGLLVPVDSKRDVIDLIEALRLPVLLVARAGLGTLNHAGLSLKLLELRRVRVLAVLMAEGSAVYDPSRRDNARLIEERHGVRVLGPVRFQPDPERRRAAFRKALQPLIVSSPSKPA